MNRLTLKAARVNREISQTEAAKQLNIAPRTLRNWENGRTYPRVEALCALCRLYGVSPDDLVLPK